MVTSAGRGSPRAALASIDLNLLVALDALLRDRSVTRAGRRIGLSQPAMSHALARLRELLGDPILTRDGRMMRRSALGERLAPRVLQLLGEIFPGMDVTAGSTLRLGSLSFDVVDLGPGESPADSLYRLSDGEWFVGDLVYSRMHSYLADGFATQWLACLDRLERELIPSALLYAGHGDPGGIALIDAQRRYVQVFMESVDRHLSAAPAERRAAVVTDMKRFLPTEDLAFLMELSVDPYVARLQARSADVPG